MRIVLGVFAVFLLMFHSNGIANSALAECPSPVKGICVQNTTCPWENITLNVKFTTKLLNPKRNLPENCTNTAISVCTWTFALKTGESAFIPRNRRYYATSSNITAAGDGSAVKVSPTPTAEQLWEGATYYCCKWRFSNKKRKTVECSTKTGSRSCVPVPLHSVECGSQ